MTLKGLHHAVVLAAGWRRALIAFVAGAASTLALAPAALWPIMFLTFPVLVWLIDGAAGERSGRGLWIAAVTGWWFGFGYFTSGLYWIGHAFLVDAETFGWLLPGAVLGLPACLAIFTGIGVATARLLWTGGMLRIPVLAAGLTAAEWLRGHALTGFPWNAFGYSLAGMLELAQAAALVGIWGLTFIAVAVFAAPATLADDRADTRWPWLPIASGLVVLSALALFGTLRLARMPTTFVDGVRLRIMQPNLQQDEKFDYTAKDQVMDRYIGLSERATGPYSRGLGDVTHLIWPELPFPFYLNREPAELARIVSMLPPGTVLITGADRVEEARADGGAAGTYNSIYAIDRNGIVALYDKVHLVPFGEFLPFQSLLERLGLMQLTKVEGGFLAADRRRLMPVPLAPPLLPMLCYEIIFPGEAVPRGERPGWIVNLTNDGWFGMSTGPYQHLQQARVRAIEEGLPLVRAANTGVSAVVDPVGRFVRTLPLGVEGVLDAPLPGPIEPTVYARFGDVFAGLLVAMGLILGVRRRMRN